MVRGQGEAQEGGIEDGGEKVGKGGGCHRYQIRCRLFFYTSTQNVICHCNTEKFIHHQYTACPFSPLEFRPPPKFKQSPSMLA